jgi:putative ABC transport system ATP-binding protein
VTRPPLILADEPTGNLDSATSTEIMNLLSELQRSGMTVIFVTHEPDIAAFAQRKLRSRTAPLSVSPVVRLAAASHTRHRMAP